MKKTMIALGSALLLTAGAVSAQTTSVTGPSALTGNFGFEIDYDASNNNAAEAYVEKNLGTGNTAVSVAFQVNADNMALTAVPNEKFVSFIRFFKENGPERVRCIGYVKRNNSNTNNRWGFGCRRDNGTFAFRLGFLGNGTHDLEIRVQASSSPGANDGSFEIFRDGASQGGQTGLDMDDFDLVDLRVGESGVTTRVDAEGTLFFDSVVVSAL